MASDACCTPAPPAEHYNEGKFETIGGVNCFVNNPSSKTAIILAPGVFGFDTPLERKLADKTGAAGFYAILPDYFHGDPYIPKDLANPFGNIGPWIAIHHPDASVDDTKSIIKELKAQGVQSVGISGFCWGGLDRIESGGHEDFVVFLGSLGSYGRLAAMVGKEDDLVQAVVMLHPSLTTVENIKDLKVPTAILSAEIDDVTPPSLAQEFKEILDTKPFPSLVKVFPGQTHGWTTAYDVNDPHQVKGAEEAHTDMLEFYESALL